MSTTEAPRPTEPTARVEEPRRQLRSTRPDMGTGSTTGAGTTATASWHRRTGRTVALQLLDAGYLLHDADGTVVDANEAATRLLGVPFEHLVGTTWFDRRWEMVDDAGRPLSGLAHPVTVTRHQRRPVTDVELGMRRRDHGSIWLRVSTALLRPDDAASECVMVLEDVTDGRALDRVLRTVQAVDDTMLRATSADELMSNVCRAVVEGGDYGLAWIGVAARSGGAGVEIAASWGDTAYLYDGIVSTSTEDMHGLGPMGTSLRDSVSVVVHDVTTDPVFAPWRDRAIEHHFASVGTYPLRIDGRPAALAVYAPVARAFDTEAHSLLAGLVSRLDHGLARLERTDRLRTSLEATITTINNLTVARDPYTAGHHERVAELSVAIGEELGLGPAVVDGIRLGALVHDIGKIGLPAEILSRPGRLDPVEYELIKRHSSSGGRILSDGMLPWPVPQIAAQHHERCDGSGYPLGLLGHEIELPARIVAVADVVEAVAHHRPYRAGLGLDTALTIVRDGAGVGFDADVVAACEQVFEQGFRFSTDGELAAGKPGGVLPNSGT